MTQVVTLEKVGASIPELALEYGVSEALLYNLANDGKLPGARRLGKRIVVARRVFAEWVESGMGA